MSQPATDPQIIALSQMTLDVLDVLKNKGELPAEFSAPINWVRTKDPAHGDFACNVALIGAKQVGKRPQELAEAVLAELLSHGSDLVERAEVAGAGFINVFLKQTAKFAVLDDILSQGEKFGQSELNKGQKIQVEFVSANPTSSLHVGHGRGAAYGMSVANLLQATGYEVCREYYVNDAGRQMDILATSTYLRYLQACGESVTFPSNGYRGDYVADLVRRYLMSFAMIIIMILAYLPKMFALTLSMLMTKPRHCCQAIKKPILTG